MNVSGGFVSRCGVVGARGDDGGATGDDDGATDGDDGDDDGGSEASLCAEEDCLKGSDGGTPAVCVRSEDCCIVSLVVHEAWESALNATGGRALACVPPIIG